MTQRVLQFCGQYERMILAAILLFGLLARLPFVTVDFHTTNDLDVYRRWARTIHARGLATIYDSTDVNYPPLLLYVFGGMGLAEGHLPATLRAGDRALTALLKLPSVLADVLTAWLIIWALKGRTPTLRILACLLYISNPAVWYVSAHWGQTDSVYTLFLVAAVVALAQGALPCAWLAYGLALGTKIQSLALAPLLVVVTLVRRGMRGLAGGCVIGLITGALLITPWLITGQLSDVLRASLTVPNQIPRVDVSAYNLWYLLFLGNVHNISSALHPAGLPLSYQQLGVGVFGTFVLLVAALVWRHKGESLAVPATLFSMGLFMLLTDVHERYLFPALAFLLLGAVGWDSPPGDPAAKHPGLWSAYSVLSLTFLFNLVTIAPFTPTLGACRENLWAKDGQGIHKRLG